MVRWGRCVFVRAFASPARFSFSARAVWHTAFFFWLLLRAHVGHATKFSLILFSARAGFPGANFRTAHALVYLTVQRPDFPSREHILVEHMDLDIPLEEEDNGNPSICI